MTRRAALGCVALCFLLVNATDASDAGRAPRPSIYTEAVELLKDFVRAGDHQLGFRDTTEFAGAFLDSATSIPVYRRLIDSLNAYHLDTTDVFHEHRTLYPVFVGKVVHSYVMFDSVFDSGIGRYHWAPVQFSGARALEH